MSTTALDEAAACMARGAYHAALRHFAVALSQEPEDAAAHASLSICLASLDRRYGALKEAERALQLAPEAAGSHVAHGFALMLMSDMAGARRSLARAKALEPHDPDVLLLACDLALHERRPKALREAAEELIRERPWDPNAKEYLSRAASMAGEGAKAEQLAREALEVNPESADFHVALGWAYVAQGKYRQAKDAALNALAIAGDHRAALALLAIAKLRSDPLTGWVHWLQLLLLSRSQTGRAVIVIGMLAAKMVGDEVFAHYDIPGAKMAVDLAYWAIFALGMISYFWISAALKRDVEKVRLGGAF